MRTVGLKTLKNKLSEYVSLAAAGETVVITDRGRTVAEIVPPGRKPAKSVIERGVREGWLTPAKRPLPGLAAAGQAGTRADVRTTDGAIWIEIGKIAGDLHRQFSRLARLLFEPAPRPRFWEEDLVSSRLLEYEVWNRVNAYGSDRRTVIEPGANVAGWRRADAAGRDRCWRARWSRCPRRFARSTRCISRRCRLPAAARRTRRAGQLRQPSARRGAALSAYALVAL